MYGVLRHICIYLEIIVTLLCHPSFIDFCEMIWAWYVGKFERKRISLSDLLKILPRM